MSTLTAIRAAVKTTLEANINGLLVYDTMAGVTQVPSAVVLPDTADFAMGMSGGNCVKWMFSLFVLAPYTDPAVGQDSLDSYVDGSGSKSIRAVVKSNSTLGLADVSAMVMNMNDYGGQYTAAQVQHIGAKLSMQVIVTQ